MNYILQLLQESGSRPISTSLSLSLYLVYMDFSCVRVIYKFRESVSWGLFNFNPPHRTPNGPAVKNTKRWQNDATQNFTLVEILRRIFVGKTCCIIKTQCALDAHMIDLKPFLTHYQLNHWPFAILLTF